MHYGPHCLLSLHKHLLVETLLGYTISILEGRFTLLCLLNAIPSDCCSSHLLLILGDLPSNPLDLLKMPWQEEVHG